MSRPRIAMFSIATTLLLGPTALGTSTTDSTAEEPATSVTIYSSADPAGFDPQRFIGQQRNGGERGVCDRCGAAPVAPEGDTAAFELNPMLCGHYERETPRGEQLASSFRPDPYRLEAESEDEPLLERMSRQFADFFSCGIGCGTPPCFAD